MRTWDEHVTDYLRLRRQLGFKLAWDEHLLGEFTSHLNAAQIEHLTIETAISWASLPRSGAVEPAASRAPTRLSAVHSFASYMHAINPVHEVIPRGVFSHRTRRTIPYIYTPGEIANLLDAAASLSRFGRDRIYPAVFGLLASTGLRVGEALGLDTDEADLNAGVLTISRGKSRDPRLVPMHPTTTAAMDSYACWRDRHLQRGDAPGDNRAFFVDVSGHRLPYPNVRHAFRRARDAAGLTATGAKPRIHDLRHTFAVTTLLGWYRNGADIAALMPTLSTYLGHTNPSNTYWYFTAVPELLAHAANRLDIAAHSRMGTGS